MISFGLNYNLVYNYEQLSSAAFFTKKRGAHLDSTPFDCIRTQIGYTKTDVQ